MAGAPIQRSVRGVAACAVVCLFVALASTRASAQTIPLTWDPVTDASVAGYFLYVGTQSGSYTETHDVGKRTSFAYPARDPGLTYYFTVAAYAADGRIGTRSPELRWTGSRLELASVTSGAGARNTPPVDAAPPAEAPDIPGSVCTERGGSCFAVALLARSAGTLSSVAEAGGTWVFAVEDGRRVRTASRAGWTGVPALSIQDPGETIAQVVPDPQFAATGHVFVAIVRARRDGTRELSVVRYRDVQGVFGEARTVIPGIPLPESGDAPIGLDGAGHLYVAVPAGSGNWRDPYAAAILRFNTDGTVPAGSRAMSPIFARGYTGPAAMAADATAAELWLAATDVSAGPLVARLPVADEQADSWPRIPGAAPLPAGSTAPVGIAVLPAGPQGLPGRYMVGMPDRLYDLGTPARASGSYVIGGVDGIQSIAAGQTGVLYVAAAGGNSSGGSVLLVLVPQAAR